MNSLICYMVVFIITLQMSTLLEASPYNKDVIMPDVCKGKNYCTEKGDDYPTHLFEEYVPSPLSTSDMEKTTETGDRQGGDDEPLQPCSSYLKKGTIHYIKDVNGDVRYVAQTEKFQQLFDIRECNNPGLLSNVKFLPFDEYDIKKYKVRCVNKLVAFDFLVLRHDRKGVEVVTINEGLPMACSCEYTITPKDYEDFPESDENNLA